jgi:hypothetical protein
MGLHQGLRDATSGCNMMRMSVVLRCVDNLLRLLFLWLHLHGLFLSLRLECLLGRCLREVHLGSEQPCKLILLHVCLLLCFSADIDAR